MNSNKFIPMLGLLILLILAIGSISASDVDSDSIMGDSDANIDLAATETAVNEIDGSSIDDEENTNDIIANVDDDSISDNVGSIDDVESEVGVENSLGTSADNEILASTVKFTEDKYSTYFNGSGNIIAGKLKAGDTLDFSGAFNSKTFIINIPLDLTSTDGTASFTNCNFKIVNGAQGTNITNLKANMSKLTTPIFDVYNVSSISISNCYLFSNATGSYPILFNTVNNSNIFNNRVQTTCYVTGWGHPSAIVLSGTFYNNISNNNVITNDSNAIYLTGYLGGGDMGQGGGVNAYNLIFNNTVHSIRGIEWAVDEDGKTPLPSSFTYGIQVMGAHNDIINNTVYNVYRGIGATQSGNKIIGNVLSKIHGTWYSGNTNEDGGEYAIYVTTNSIVKYNIISDSIFYGDKAAIFASKGSNVTNNTLFNITGIGAYLGGSDIIFSENNLNVTGYGVYIFGQSESLKNIIVSNNQIFSNNQSNVKLEKKTRLIFPNDIVIVDNILHNLGVIPISFPVESDNLTIEPNTIIIDGVIDDETDDGAVHLIYESNFNKFFSATGNLEDWINENDTLIFMGEFSSKDKLTINQKVDILGVESKFTDTTFIIENDGVSIKNIKISNPNTSLKDRLWGIQVNGVKDVTIQDCDISINDPYSAYAIYLLEASNCTIINNVLEARGDYFTVALLSFNSRDIFIDGNTIRTIGSGETYLINNKSCLDGYLNICIDACLDGSVVCPDGFVVCPDGSLMCPDGAIIAPDEYYICVDGSIVCVDGTVICTDGSTLNGEVCTDGVCVDGVTYCIDGTIILENGTKVYAGGYQITAEDTIICPDGTIINPGEYTVNETDGSIKCPDGTVICTDGSIICTDGSTICTDGAGSSNYLDGVIPGSHMVSGVYRTYGALLIHSSNVTFTNNNVNVGSDLPADYNLNESYNTIAGVFIHYGGFNNTISNNEIILNANDPVMYGIGIIGASPNSSAEGSKYNNFTNNHVKIVGPLHGVGVVLGYKAIECNFIENNFEILTNHSIEVLTFNGSESNVVEGNTFIKKLNSIILVSNSSYKLDNLNKIISVSLKDEEGKAIANSYVEISVNGQKYTAKTNANGVATVNVTLNAVKTYDISVKFNGEEYFFASTANGKITVTKGTSSLTSPTKTFTVTTASKTITVTLKDGSGNVIANRKVTATVNGKTYTATTNSKGVATFKLTLKTVKTFTVSLKFVGDSYYTASTKSIKVKVTKTKTKLTVPKKTFKRAAKVKKITATLKDQTGKVIKSKKVTFTVNGKKYTAKTNKKGVATVKVKLSKKKTYKVTVKFAGDKTYYAVKKTGKVVIK